MDPLRINNRLSLSPDEVEVRTSRSSGPGGQRLNKVETRVELRVDLHAWEALGEARRTKLLERLESRLTKDGVLIVVNQEYRERLRNLEAARARLATLIREALVDPKTRRKTKPTKGSQRRRLDGKRKRSQIKRWRSGDSDS